MKFVKQMPDDFDMEVPWGERSNIGCLLAFAIPVLFWAVIIILALI